MILLIDCNCVILGPTQCRNFDDHRKHIAKSHDNRNICLSHLKRTLANGEVVNRNWVVYSPSKNAIFCFVCRLFGSFNIFDVYKSTGFTDFHNANRSFAQHEKSQQHLRNELDYKTRAKKSQSTTIDSNILNQNRSEAEYWRKILTRIVAVIKFLGSRGLPRYRPKFRLNLQRQLFGHAGTIEPIRSVNRIAHCTIRKQRER